LGIWFLTTKLILADLALNSGLNLIIICFDL